MTGHARLSASAREVAQTGAAIGREFSYKLLVMLADRTPVPVKVKAETSSPSTAATAVQK